jgi:hypothetical protein
MFEPHQDDRPTLLYCLEIHLNDSAYLHKQRHHLLGQALIHKAHLPQCNPRMRLHTRRHKPPACPSGRCRRTRLLRPLSLLLLLLGSQAL